MLNSVLGQTTVEVLDRQSILHLNFFESAESDDIVCQVGFWDLIKVFPVDPANMPLRANGDPSEIVHSLADSQVRLAIEFVSQKRKIGQTRLIPQEFPKVMKGIYKTAAKEGPDEVLVLACAALCLLCQFDTQIKFARRLFTIPAHSQVRLRTWLASSLHTRLACDRLAQALGVPGVPPAHGVHRTRMGTDGWRCIGDCRALGQAGCVSRTVLTFLSNVNRQSSVTGTWHLRMTALRRKSPRPRLPGLAWGAMTSVSAAQH